jgi:hypothetical protein
MASNIYQKIALLDIDQNSKTLIEQKLFEGWVIQHIVFINSINKLLVVYSMPENID